jgi:MFS family permease
VINGYAVVFGVLIVTGGRLADQFGRRRVFMIGAAVTHRHLLRWHRAHA